MAISQTEYAAELIDPEAQRVLKFDDIGCMAQFFRARNLHREGIYFFVRDYGGRGWLKGDSARYVQSDRIPSPMASGLIAVSDGQEAQKYATKFNGKALRFSDILKGK